MSSDQQELFKADLSWFKMFRELIRSGKWAELSLTAKACYPVIRSYTSSDGSTFPSYSTLMKYTGIKSRSSLSIALQDLEKHNIIERYTIGTGCRAQACYKLTDDFRIHDTAGNQVAVASVPYIPEKLPIALAEFKTALESGLKNLNGLQNLTVQITMNVGDNNRNSTIAVSPDGVSKLESILLSLENEPVDN